MTLLRWLLGEPYDPLDLETHPKGWKPCYDFVGTPERESLLAFALRGAPIDQPDLDPSRMILGRERR